MFGFILHILGIRKKGKERAVEVTQINWSTASLDTAIAWVRAQRLPWKDEQRLITALRKQKNKQ